MENLYKLYVSINADLRKETPLKAVLYEYRVLGVKNKYIEIDVAGSKKRISFDKLNVIQDDIQTVQHISYFVWLDSDNKEDVDELISEIKNKIIDKFLVYKKTVDRLESNLKQECIFSKEIIDERY